jgi:hypothetical protein
LSIVAMMPGLPAAAGLRLADADRDDQARTSANAVPHVKRHGSERARRERLEHGQIGCG